jgi:hypothetical protein
MEEIKQEERWAINVDGINMPGYSSYDEAQGVIDRDPDLQKRGARATQLCGVKQKTFLSFKEACTLLKIDCLY